jgi:hypothetical protein
MNAKQHMISASESLAREVCERYVVREDGAWLWTATTG